jgi:hypothetical protein
MSTHLAARSGAAVAHRALSDLAARLDLPLPDVALPGADLLARSAAGRQWPDRARLLRATDGWVHPGPSTAWPDFRALVESLGARPTPGANAPDADLPDVSALSAEAIDAEAGAWLLPAVAIRSTPATAPIVPETRDRPDLHGATVLVLGTAWAAPLAGQLLHRLGARVVRLDDPRRADPFPLRDALADGQERITPDLTTSRGRDALAGLFARADLLIDGYTPRVLANAGFADTVLAGEHPRLARVRVAAFAADDRPGYGPAAECRGGWAARHDPPRLGRSSVADPVAGLLAALEAVHRVAAGGGSARVSLEGAVGHLLAVERSEA